MTDKLYCSHCGREIDGFYDDKATLDGLWFHATYRRPCVDEYRKSRGQGKPTFRVVYRDSPAPQPVKITVSDSASWLLFAASVIGSVALIVLSAMGDSNHT